MPQWVIYDNDSAAIVSTGSSSIDPDVSGLAEPFRILVGVTCDPSTFRMTADRLGVEPIPEE